jgi:hypothetical protein
VDSPGLHLVRSAELAAEIDALAAALGGRVGLPGVAASLNRVARVGAARGTAARWGFRWDQHDSTTLRWWPQGITTSADASDSEEVLGRSWVVTSAYSKQLRDLHKGSRLTFVDVSDPVSVPYRHVLLVEPYVDGAGRVDVRPVKVHAGGIVWHGPYLHVAATARGLCSFRVDDILAVPPGDRSRLGLGVGAFGYRFVLPLRFRYDAPAPTGLERMRYSFLSLDRSTAPFELLAGEYGHGPMTTRLIHYDLDPATKLLRTGSAESCSPLRLPGVGVERMQGAVVVGGRYYVTTSAGRLRAGSLWEGRPGELREHRGVLPAGPEDLAYWPSRDQLWSLTEHPGRRHVFAMARSDFGG